MSRRGLSTFRNACRDKGQASKNGLRRDFTGNAGLGTPTKLPVQDVPNYPRQELPSQEEGRRSHLAKRFSHVMDHLQSNIFIAGQRLNDLTGYSGIEALKRDIEEQEEIVRNTRSSLQVAKEAYAASIAQRSASQREVNSLLQRKHAWTPQDLERFTSLYRSDHANEQAESAAQQTLTEIERKSEEAAAKLSAGILARYHEEQIWSDKIRRMSTWGTWGLMGVNVLLFLVFQIGVEPWRRRRLVKGFEEKVLEALEKEGAATGVALAAVKAGMVKAGERSDKENMMEPDAPPAVEEFVLAEAAEETAKSVSIEHVAKDLPCPRHALSIEAFWDLFSDRKIIIRKAELTTMVLGATTAGLAMASILTVLLRPR